MRPEKSQKQLTITNALARLKRASISAENAFRTRRHEILASNCIEGRRCFLALMQQLQLNTSVECRQFEEFESIATEDQETFKRAVINFVSEPAQRSAVDRVKGSGLANADPDLSINGAPCYSHLTIPKPSIAKLAWGAFSLKKVLQHQSLVIENSGPRHFGDGKPSAQLGLQDLSIIDCAVRYQDYHFEYAYMRLLSADGAALVHRVAMLVAIEHNLRIDIAIATAARILIDPLVGGDADHCCSMLRAHSYPSSWGEQYNLY